MLRVFVVLVGGWVAVSTGSAKWCGGRLFDRLSELPDRVADALNVDFLHQGENREGNDLLIDRITVGTGQVFPKLFLVPRVLVDRAVVNVDTNLLVAKVLEQFVAADTRTLMVPFHDHKMMGAGARIFLLQQVCKWDVGELLLINGGDAFARVDECWKFA